MGKERGEGEKERKIQFSPSLDGINYSECPQFTEMPQIQWLKHRKSSLYTDRAFLTRYCWSLDSSSPCGNSGCFSLRTWHLLGSYHYMYPVAAKEKSVVETYLFSLFKASARKWHRSLWLLVKTSPWSVEAAREGGET